MERLEVLEKSIGIKIDKYNDMLSLIEEGICENFFEEINSSNRIFIYGKGTSSAIVGKELKRAFTALGKYVFDFYKADEIDAVLSLIRDDDCIVIISTENTKNYLDKINKRLENEKVGKFFIGKDKEKMVPICTSKLDRIYRNYDENYEGISDYCILVEFLYKLCSMGK